ncbi:MAG: hypothetical protein AAF434_09380 [Pseudomonadota bacterium]
MSNYESLTPPDDSFATRKMRLLRDSWCTFDVDEKLSNWVTHALPAARETLNDPRQAQWLRYQGTWFAGVNALPNDANGRLPGGPPLAGKVIDFVHEVLELRDFVWDRAQVSICYPGYPQPMQGQSAPLHRFRRDRDAAHVDGLLPEGPDRRRHLREHHAFILGIPMVPFSADASPFVVWEGSHHVIRDALRARLHGIDPSQWGEQDITDAYQGARREVFERCRRVEIHVNPGQAFLAHRLSVHGMAPWDENAIATDDGRMIAYFRPEFVDVAPWLEWD